MNVVSARSGRSPRSWFGSAAAVVVITLAMTACSAQDPVAEGSSPPASTPSQDDLAPTPSQDDRAPTSTLRPTQLRRVMIPVTGAYFGTHFSATLADREETITDLESHVGRMFSIDHVYHGWDTPFPSEYDRWTVGEGRTLFLSWTTRRGDSASTAKWADIVAGLYDELIDERAAAMVALGRPVLMSFDHEPSAQVGDGEGDSGSVEDYRAAWQHVVDRFDGAGAANVSWVWTMTAYNFRTADPTPFYPGDEIVDWVGVDGYTNIECPWLDVPWRSWEEIFGAANTFATRHDKPLVIAEFSAREDEADPERKASWLLEAVDAVESMPSIKAVVSFNSTQTCSSIIASSERAVQAYRDVGASPVFSAVDADLAATAGRTP